MANEEDEELLGKVASILLSPDDDAFKVSYKRVEGQLFGGSQDSKNTTSVKVSVRKIMANVVRPVWEGQLNNICHKCYDGLPLFARNALPEEMSQNEASSGLSFSVMLGDTINKLHKEIDALRTENKTLEANTLRWKSTSEKLSGQWESEKSELTERFLTLFNEHKARHVESLKELEQLKSKEQRGAERTGATIGNRDSLGGRPSLEVPDHEDEHDFAEYDDEMVDRLAAGRKSSQKRRLNDRMEVMAGKRQQKRQNTESQGHYNPHTGAREFGNAKELFSSDSETDDNAATGRVDTGSKNKKATLSKKFSSDSETDDDAGGGRGADSGSKKKETTRNVKSMVIDSDDSDFDESIFQKKPSK